MSRIKGLILSFGCLLAVSAAVQAGEPAPMSSLAPAQCATVQNSSPAAALPDTVPAWIEAASTSCGAGCPASGAGTDSSCLNKNIGDTCGVGATCMPFYTVPCPPPNKRCICITQ